jgi:16S rRNA (guanine966-N2)-methyltransferase
VTAKHAPRAAGAGAPGVVRLIGGRWKRSKLPVADRPGLRPTPDRVRETLFNWLGQDLTGWQVLDAFAGSGALGFEAASRGALSVTLLEHDAALVQLLRDAQRRLGGEQALRIVRADALAWMVRAAPESFDVVLLDPPFDAGLHDAALAAAAPLVRPGGLIYLESRQRWATLPPGYAMHREDRAGGVHFHLLRREGGG